ncbi:hypothetical protein ACHRVZ_04485 [Flavobacterium sp. FlaQc-57]|uniref:hypothetical protein n=1 Tax=Flavobacterium sp. FlaQc-57 TaxID=3374186 RepID=UPI003757BC60
MKKIYFSFLLLTFVPLHSFCQQKKVNPPPIKEELIIGDQETGKIEDNKYKCNLFDWQIEIPEGFTITSKERAKELEDKGYEAMKEHSTEGKNVSRATTTLISFEKDKYNIFSANYESLVGKKKMTFEEYKAFMLKLLDETYSGKGMKYDIANSDLKLGKYNFNKIVVHLYHPKTDALILTQEFYSSYINNHLYTAGLNYQNENAGYIMSYNFMKSFK